MTRSSFLVGSALTLALACSSGNPPPFAARQSHAGPIVVDRGEVLWGTTVGPAYIRKCPTAGCNGSPDTIYTGPEIPAGLAVDATTVYFAIDAIEHPVLAACARAGCGASPTILAQADSRVSDVAIDGTHLFWATNSGVWGCTIAGCAPRRLAPIEFATTISALAVDATRVYWGDASADAIVAVAIDGGAAPTVVAPGQASPSGLVIHGTRLSWTNEGRGQQVGTVMTCDLTDCAGSMVTLATKQGSPFRIAVDDVAAYWTTSDPPTAGTVMKCALGGCDDAPQIVARGAEPWAIAVDDTTVYWTDVGAEVVLAAPKR